MLNLFILFQLVAVRILNLSNAPITVYQVEKLGVIEYGTEIDNGGATPVRHPSGHLPLKFVKKLLDDMLEQKIIELSSGPWSSPNIPVSNIDGIPRFYGTIIE